MIDLIVKMNSFEPFTLPLVNFPHSSILWMDLWTEEAMRAHIVYRMANRCESDIKIGSSHVFEYV